MNTAFGRRALAVVFAVLLVVPAFAGVAAADQRVGGTVVVEEGETVTDGLQATAGTVIVRGTVEGDLEAFAGTVAVEDGGTVTGDLTGAAGSITVAGTVEGDAELAGGSFVVAESGVVGGDVRAGVGSFRLDGTVRESVRVGAGSITLGPQAVIEGDLVYDGDLERAEGSAVGGEVRHDPNLAVDVVPMLPEIASWVVTVYSLLVTMLVGALLLLLLPGVSATVAEEARTETLRTAGLGFLALVGVPVVLVVVMLTLIGIPVAIVGFLLYALVLMLAYIWGEYAVGSWLVSRSGRDNRWLALIVGVLVVFLLELVPFLGGLVSFVVLLLGLGGVGVATYRAVRGRRGNAA